MLGVNRQILYTERSNIVQKDQIAQYYLPIALWLESQVRLGKKK